LESTTRIIKRERVFVSMARPDEDEGIDVGSQDACEGDKDFIHHAWWVES
jgi:hypothetical protein